MREWKGSVAFITGGAQGIGLGTARALGKRGVRLALADIDEGALASSKKELSQLTEVETFPLDVRDRAGYAAAAAEAEARLGSVDLLFNNAGIAPYSSLPRMGYEQWDLVLGINLNGVINGIQTFLPRMLERGTGGYIVNTASGAGLLAGTNALYATSKFAVVGLSESLRLQAAKYGIEVSVLCPAYVDTNIVATTAALAGGVSIGQTAAMAHETVDNLKAGKSIDEVGETVIAGMEAKAMWIFTDDVIAPYLKLRTEMMLKAFPTVVETES